MRSIDVSIKWKILTPVALVLAICAIVFLTYYQRQLLARFEQNRIIHIEQQTRLINDIIESSSIGNQKVENVFEFYAEAVTLETNSLSARNASFLKFLENLKNDDSIDNFQLFYRQDVSAEAQYLSVDDDSGGVLNGIDRLELFSSQRYRRFVNCQDKCIVYSRLKISHPVGGETILFSGFYLYRLVDRFQLLSESDLAILSTYPQDASTHRSLWLDNYSAFLESATRLYRVLSLLKRVAKFDKQTYDGESFQITQTDKIWQANFVSNELDGIYFVLIDDLTDQLAALESARQQSFLLIAIGFSFVLLALYALLYRPLTRIRKIGLAVSLLGKGQFRLLRDSIGVPSSESPKRDEIEMIHQTAYTVSTILEDVESRRARNERMIRKLAEHDELTGLHNRQHFLSQVNQWIDANTHSFVYMFIDLNYFKQINDRFGHTGGDSTLKSVADIIALETPAGTLIGRIGGDEFSIAIRDISPSEAASIANKINQMIRKITLPGFSEPALLSASIGIALFPKHGSSQFQLNLHADMAMYMAKKTKKPVYFYSPEISQALLTVFQKRQYIRDLIDNDGLCLYLQPIFDIHTNLVFSLECLSRVIDNSKRQMISSDELFSYAAQCSMAAELDLHILSLLLRDNQLPQIINNFCVGTDQEHDVNAGIRINFNVSAQSVTEPGFFDRLHALCQENNVGFDQLVIEVTEGENVDDFAKATAFMKKVQSQGGLVALDDFGDGFAGLNYLRTLPFDIVKIDGQFIHNIDQDPIHQVIVNTMIAVCNKLNMKVVVESIETEAELNYCHANGVDMVQGWHLSKEIAISECIYNANESVASVM